MTSTVMQFSTGIPGPREASLAQASAQALASKIVGHPDTIAIRFAEDAHEVIELPFVAVRLLIDLLNEMAEGNAGVAYSNQCGANDATSCGSHQCLKGFPGETARQ